MHLTAPSTERRLQCAGLAGYTQLHAGLSILPFSIILGTASRLAGRATASIGPRWPLTIGPIIASLNFALMMQLDPHGGYWTGVAPGIVVVASSLAKLQMRCSVTRLKREFVVSRNAALTWLLAYSRERLGRTGQVPQVIGRSRGGS